MKIARWLGRAASLVVVSSVCLALIPGCGSDAKDACEKFNSLCSGDQGGSDADAGVSVSVQLTCNADQLDEASNVDEVADCMENAKDCSAAVTCLAKAKK